jgi:3-oxoadipate enol-lactonase
MLELPDVSLFYETSGEKGPWITLVNGHTRSSRDFKLLARSLAAAGFQVLTFDNRGSGQTQSKGPFTCQDMVKDVFALWDKFGIKGSFLVGISMGGMISQFVAAERPSAVTGLILISTGSGDADLNPLSFGGWGRTQGEVLERLSHYVTADFKARNKLLIDAMAKQILQSIQNEGFEERANAQRIAMKGIDTSPVLGKISCPTLILHGELDEIIRIEAAYGLTRQIDKAELKVLPGRGHLLLAEDSKTLADDIIEFCQSHRA